MYLEFYFLVLYDYDYDYTIVFPTDGPARPSARLAYRSKLLLLRIMASSMSNPVYEMTATTALVP